MRRPDRGAVDLATTGSGGSIGASVDPITTAIDGELTATTNDGGVYIADSGTGLTINSVVADQGGPSSGREQWSNRLQQHAQRSPPTYAPGDENVSISSTGPIVLNSVSATGDVTITSSAYILEGNAQSPNIIAQEVDLIAEGTADYQGQVTFADSHWRRYDDPAHGGPTGARLVLRMAIRFSSRARLASADDGRLHHRDRGEQCPHFDAK